MFRRPLAPAWAFLAGAMVMLAMATASIIYLRSYTQTTAKVAHFQQVSQSLLRLLSNVQDAEAAERGYLLVGQEQYVQEYQRALERAEAVLADLQRLTDRDRPNCPKLLQSLGDLLGAQRAELDKAAQARRADGLQAAVAAMRAQLGVRPADQIRSTVDNLNRDEARMLEQQSLWSDRQDRRLAITTLCGAILAVLLVGLAVWRAYRSQRQLARRTEELQETVRLLDLANVVVLDMDGRIIRWNSRAERTYGYTARQALGRLAQELLHTQFSQPFEQIKATLVATGQWEGEMIHTRSDGQRLAMASLLVLHRDGHGRPAAILKVNNDITELKRIQEQLQEAKQAAEQASRAKDHFLAVLSHELRTPLTPVLAVADLLEKDHAVSAEIRADAEMIRRNVALEARLIDDLLDLTRITRGKIELACEDVDCAIILRRAVEVCAADIEARCLHFAMELKDTPLCLHADPSRLEQVFWNLLKNAIKFTPPGGHVRVRGHREDGQAIIEVSDTGTGIDAAALSRIFNAFEQADRDVTRQFGGLGLGLAISKALVQLHGGAIEAHSEGRGKGAMFRVKLPMVEGSGFRVQGSERGPTTLNPEPRTLNPLRILLVEDHGDTARIMRQILQGEGHKVRTAADVASALDLAAGEDFDLVISDLGLPDGSGLDLMRQLRNAHQGLRGIALSGFGRDEDVAHSREAGFAEHLTKPIDLGHLDAAIARVGGAPVTSHAAPGDGGNSPGSPQPQSQNP